MRIEGNLNSILSNHRLYVKINLSKHTEDEAILKRNFISSFFKEDRAMIEQQICKIKESKNLEKRNRETEKRNLHENQVLENLEIENKQLEIQESSSICDSVDAVDNPTSPAGFLNFVKSMPVKENVKEDLPEDEESVHGIYIDEWVKVEEKNANEEFSIDDLLNELGLGEDESDEEATEVSEVDSEVENTEVSEVDSEVENTEVSEMDSEVENTDSFIDDLLSELGLDDDVSDEETTEEPTETIHGLYIDEYEPKKVEVQRAVSKPKEDTKPQQEDYLSSLEINKQKEEIKEEVKEKIEQKEEVIVVPTNIRDFIKTNQGCTEDYVLKYYDKKVLVKAISLGKVYKKQGKLYI